MQTNGIDEQRCIARATPRYRIGVDSDGRRHYFDPAHAIIWVMADSDSVEVCYRTRDLASWRAYVAERCGWDDHSISGVSTAELAAAAIAEAAR